MSQQPDSILDALDQAQGVRLMRTVPPTPGADPPDMFRGQTFTRPQVEKHARDLGLDYDTVRAGVVERGGRVLDDSEAAAPSMSWAIVNGQRVPVVEDTAQDPILAALDQVQREPQRPEPSLLDRAVPMAMRVGGAIGGGLVGGLVSSPTIVGIPAGVLAGGAAGAGLGETGAEMYEQYTGQRSELNPWQIGTQTVLGGIPMGRVAGATIPQIAARRALQGGGMGALSAGATEYAESGELPTVGQLGRGAVLGGVMGGGLGGVEGRILQRSGRLNVPAPPVREPAGYLPPGATFTVTPDGRAVPMGTDVPMVPASDGSYVRGVPAEVARREPRGLLPGGRARFVAGEHGPAIPIEQADPVIAALDAAQGRTPAQSSVRSQRAAVLEHEIDPTQPTAQAVRVRQYAGDVNASGVPLVGEPERRMLTLMREDLQTFAPQRGRLIHDPNDPGFGIYAHGGPGSRVADDVRAIAGNRPDNQSITRAIDDLLEGRPVTNKVQIAALDAARSYIEGRPGSGYRGPQLPMEAADEGGLDALAKRLQQESAEPVGAGARGGGGGAVAHDADFDRFVAAFNEVEPGAVSAGREPGEEGFIASQLAMHGGGALVGGAAGATQGDTAQERAENAVLFGIAGAAAPSLLSGMRGRAGATARGATTPRVAQPAQPGRVPLEAVPPRSGRSGAPIAEPLRGMEPFFDKFSNPLVRDGVEQLIVEHGGYAAQRRGVIRGRDLGKFAEEVRINVSKALPKGTPLNAEAITAYGRALVATQKKVNELAALVNSGRATDYDLLALQAARAEADVVARSLVGARAEAGRALAAFNFYNAVIDTGDVNLVRDTLRAPGLRAETERLARGLSEQTNDPLVRYRWLQQQGSSTLMQKVRSFYYANILSGVKTHERNLVGNVANVATNLVVHPFAAGIDVVKSAVKGTPRQVRVDELPAQAFGALAGLERGVGDFAFTLRYGVSPDALSRSLRAGEVGKLDVPRVEFAGGGLNPFNIPGRLLDASDTLFRSVARNMELYGLAHTQAKAEGLSGQRFLDRVAELRSGATPEGAAIRQQADTFATRTVFQEKPGKFASGLQRLTHDYPPLSLVIPFIKTPANITRQGFEFSPLGAFMQAARQEGRTGTQAQARAVAGTLAAGALTYYAVTNRLSGNGPKDRAQRAALMESGWRPNSVRIGDQWIAYQLFQPVSVQAAIISNMVEAWKERGAKPADVGDVLAATFARTANSFLDQSFLSGLFDFVEAIKDPERSAGRFGGRMVSGLVPMSAAVRTVQQGMDPVVRQPETIAETVKAGIPGLSEQVEPRIDRFGEVITREGGALRRAADPFNTSSVKDDPVARELDRLGVKLTPPSPRTAVAGGLTRAEETEVRQGRGQAVRDALERVMASPRYEQASDEHKTQALERMIDRARTRESAALRHELAQKRVGQTFDHPNLGRVRVMGVMKNGVVRVAPLLPDGSLGGRQPIVRGADLQPVGGEP